MSPMSCQWGYGPRMWPITLSVVKRHLADGTISCYSSVTLSASCSKIHVIFIHRTIQYERSLCKHMIIVTSGTICTQYTKIYFFLSSEFVSPFFILSYAAVNLLNATNAMKICQSSLVQQSKKTLWAKTNVGLDVLRDNQRLSPYWVHLCICLVENIIWE